MSYQIVDGIPVWGEPLLNAVAQMKSCVDAAERRNIPVRAALMGDHHLGYAVPVGGVIAYEGFVSPSAVGFDIACGNMAVRTDMHLTDFSSEEFVQIMDDIAAQISFGVGRRNNERVEHPLFDSSAWDIPGVSHLKEMAREQLGTVGSGNHYVDVFADQQGFLWVGVHFGSRGLGHKIATHFIKAGGGKDGINVEPVLLDVNSELGAQYLDAMTLAGQYAYAGREWVVRHVVGKILGGRIFDEVHNHHNFAWLENHAGRDLWVHRKGATPAFPGQRGFVGGTMGEDSVILQGDLHGDPHQQQVAMFSTVHGAGRVMSRTEAAGKSKWIRGQKVRVSEGKVSRESMEEWLRQKGVILRGGGTDESPHCYKRLDEVLAAHGNSVTILHTLRPLGVVMAGADELDPYKD